MASYLAMPGELTLDFASIGGGLGDAFPVIVFSIVNPSQAATFDFETEEISGVCTIKYSFQGSVVRKQEMTDASISSPILIMQDLVSPVAYLYPDTTNIPYPDVPNHTKSGRQEINYDSGIGLPVVRKAHFDFAEDITDISSIPRYAIKGNWHFLADSVICDTVSIFVRRRITQGIQLYVYNFL